MKTSLKISHKVPDLEELAVRHQDFDALMDAYTDEKIRKRRKLYKAGSFVLVILATAFLSWLYWGYEPVVQEPVQVQSESPQPPVKQLIPVEEKEQAPVVSPQPETVAEESEPEGTGLETVVATSKAEPSETEKSEEVLASPQVTIREKITADAEPVDGLENLYRYLYKEIVLPDSLIGADNTFFLEVEFEVGAEGKISGVNFNKSLPGELSDKLTRVFVGMPAWKSALDEGVPVASVMNLPITFQKKEDKE
ncbi:MAG: hypothetical protein HEP71_08340 [Roseivirga sp.]|nr:hypothetical protein [Roseivirga sp.]